MSALARFTSFDHRHDLAQGNLARGDLARGDLAQGDLARDDLARDVPARAEAGALKRLARGRGASLLMRTGLMTLAAALLAAGALGLASGLLASRPAAGEALSTTGARWADIRRPLALYDLAGTEFSKLPSTYRARRREPDGAREDVMTFGALDGAKPYLQVSLLRAGAAPPGAAAPARAAQETDGLADDLAQLAGARGLVASRLRPAAPMDTRLGRFETADLLLAGDGGATACLGFRGGDGGGGGAGNGAGNGVGSGAALRVAGFACGAPGRPLGRAALACAIDRIDLVSAGEDAALRAVFVAAERRGGRSACLGGSSLAAVGSGGRALGWLDPDGDLPPLRGLFEAVSRRR